MNQWRQGIKFRILKLEVQIMVWQWQLNSICFVSAYLQYCAVLCVYVYNIVSGGGFVFVLGG